MSCYCGKSHLTSVYDVGSLCKECGGLIIPETEKSTTAVCKVKYVDVENRRLYVKIDGKNYDYITGEEIY